MSSLAFGGSLREDLVEDPAYIVVTSLRDDVQWEYANGCDQSYYPTHAQTLFYESGWISDYQDNYTHLACGAAISNSDALMENDPFCFAAFGDPEVVYTHYNYNHEVVGKPDGSFVSAWNDWASSTLDICWRLLSWHHVTAYENLFH